MSGPSDGVIQRRVLEVLAGLVIDEPVVALHGPRSVGKSTLLNSFAAANDVDVRERDEVVVCVDVAHRGLGTASCGPDVLPQYRLPAGRYEFAYRIGVR